MHACEMDFAVPLIWYDNVQTEVTPTSTSKREEEEGKEGPCSLSEPGRLATYVSYVPCVSICLC
jgi:hypothetical protein